MKRYILFAAVVFVVLAVAFAPVRLIDRALDNVEQVDMVNASGTLWRGQGQLLVRGAQLGDVGWQFRYASILMLHPSYDWELVQKFGALTGQAGIGLNEADIAATGNFTADLVNAFLHEYEIDITGDFELLPTVIAADTEKRLVHTLDGQLNWSGGRVRYTLGGQLREATLPALNAYMQLNDQNQPQAIVYEVDASSPLIIVSQGAPGFIKVGITKLFTKMLTSPWPGSDPDHAVVLEVEEQFF
jgi:hypothetical protein